MPTQKGKDPPVTNIFDFAGQKQEASFSCTQTDGKEGTISVYEVDTQHCKKTACCLEMVQWFATTDRNKTKFH